MEEIWKPVVGYEGLYEVSNLGRIKSLKSDIKGRRNFDSFLKNELSSSGYYRQILCFKGKIKRIMIHRLVAQTFIPNIENKPCVNHKDGNKLNNKLSNLEWVTYRENRLHYLNYLKKW